MNDYNLKGRRAIVTGGAQGFGYAITKRFLESGAEVIIWDIDQKAIDEALKELSSEKCSYQIVDVTNFDDVKKNFDFESLFSLITEGIAVNKKNRDDDGTCLSSAEEGCAKRRALANQAFADGFQK